MSLPPWIKRTELTLPEKKQRGNKHESHKTYNTHAWREASARYFRGKPCVWPNCQVLAECTDHIIPIQQGGSQWDRRNWQPLCAKHHAVKSAKESHGYCEPKTGTPYGYIPTRNAHLAPDIVLKH